MHFQVQRCFRELQLLRSLNHENVVKWVSAYTEGSREAYTMLVTLYSYDYQKYTDTVTSIF